MGKVKVSAMTVSIDGFAAGSHQDLDNPLGIRGKELHTWMYKTDCFQKMIGNKSGVKDVDNTFVEKSFENVGAWILGRNMFGPIRGPWTDDTWKGWWGENPPYHCDVYILTHYERSSIKMQGGTVFHFVTDGIESALKKAKMTAKNKDVRIGGGVSTVKQYLKAGLIDEIHLACSPVFLGEGENLFSNLNLYNLGFQNIEHTATPNAMHVILKKR